MRNFKINFVEFSNFAIWIGKSGFIKKLSFQSEWRNRYTDRTGDEANNLGNKGFKGSIETEAVFETQLLGR